MRIFTRDNTPFQSLLRVSDCSGKPAKAEAVGAQERQSDRRKLLTATMSPTANDCGLVAESATAKPERPNKLYNIIVSNIGDFMYLEIK